MDPEELVHICYTVEIYLQAYGYMIMPLRDMAHWEKMNGIDIHPPVFTKVVGRPPKNRRQTPQEKKKKDETMYLNKKGLTMHCSACGKKMTITKGAMTSTCRGKQGNNQKRKKRMNLHVNLFFRYLLNFASFSEFLWYCTN